MNANTVIRRLIDWPTNVYNLVKFRVHGIKIKHGDIKGRVYIVNRGKISIDEGFRLNGLNKYNPLGFGDGCSLITEKGALIQIGKNCGISNSTIYARCSVTIGNSVLIGDGVKIYDTDFHSLNAEYRGTSEDKSHAVNAPIVIENHAFIGAGSIILKGVHIGIRAVIGAGAVITKDVPEDEVWAGNPARKIK